MLRVAIPVNPTANAYAGTAILTVTAVLIPILTFLVSMRLFLRYESNMKFGLDDITLVLSWVQ
ncbi:hypothetical protein N7456_001295 [Penicillium angulare]|uniref:Uncharacterized protein n=1 Tax=Penicillium angulare TaxID=116970 RepID=A0A9W9GE49_9EURO|nr:hypothetical protein N7456_001295 [Penicillium angulare]